MTGTDVLMIAVGAALCGGAAYLLTTSLGARRQAGALLAALRLAVGEYLALAPVADADVTALLDASYGGLPAALRTHLTRAQWETLAVPLLLQVEHALFTVPPEPRPPDAR